MQVTTQGWPALWLAAMVWLAPQRALAQSDDPSVAEPDTPGTESTNRPGSREKPRALDFDASQKKLARDLAWQGVDLYNAKKYAEATEKFAEAYTLQPVPTVTLWLARALSNQGQLVEASERYVEVMRMPIAADAPSVYTTAKRDAEQEYEALQPRVPYLSLTVDDAKNEDALIELNGLPFNPELLGSKVPFNPGRVRIVARLGSEVRSYELLLEEGEDEALQISFESTSSPDSPQPSAVPVTPMAMPKQPKEEHASVPTATWLSLAVGGAGLTAGIGFGLVAENRKAELHRLCPNNECDSRYEERHDEFNQARIPSLIGWGVGALGIALAGVFYLTAANADVETAVVVYPGGAGMRGAF